jgi:pimeloyl-ACP methyl ester carboxylesterase
MFLSASLLCACVFTEPALVQTKFVQVAPGVRSQTVLKRSPGQDRAVVLIHGLTLTQDDAVVRAADLQTWQRPGSPVIQALRGKADVFAFAYGQNAPVDGIADLPVLKEKIQALKAMGYGEIVLLGHSAGGIVARQFVEDHPDAGVTKVVQVCTPNGGSALAEFPVGAPSLRPFLASLTERARRQALKERAGKQIPAAVQCVCLLGNGVGGGDLAVSCRCQWSDDLQKQGVPVVRLGTLHFLVMSDRDCAARMAEAVCSRHARWSEAEVQRVRKQIRPGGVLLEQ